MSLLFYFLPFPVLTLFALAPLCHAGKMGAETAGAIHWRSFLRRWGRLWGAVRASFLGDLNPRPVEYMCL